MSSAAVGKKKKKKLLTKLKWTSRQRRRSSTVSSSFHSFPSSLDPTRFDFYSFKSQLELFAAGIKCCQTGRRECAWGSQTRDTSSSAQLALSRFSRTSFPSWEIRVMWRPPRLWLWTATISWSWSPWQRQRRWRVTLTRAWLRRKLVRQVDLCRITLDVAYEKGGRLVFNDREARNRLVLRVSPPSKWNVVFAWRQNERGANRKSQGGSKRSLIVCISHIPDHSNGHSNCGLQPETDRETTVSAAVRLPCVQRWADCCSIRCHSAPSYHPVKE